MTAKGVFLLFGHEGERNGSIGVSSAPRNGDGALLAKPTVELIGIIGLFLDETEDDGVVEVAYWHGDRG